MANGHGGRRPGAGKKKGVRARKTVAFLEAVKSSGETPLEFMLRVMRDPVQEFEVRADMAKAAAPYVYSKMPIAVVTPPPPSGELTRDDDAILNRYLAGLHDEADEG